MSREIKFRGKRLDTGEWVYGSYHHCANRAHHYILALEMFLYREPAAEMCMHPHDVWEVDPETVGQYTGFKDVHGNEEYEGDIISRYTGYTFECKTREFSLGSMNSATAFGYDWHESDLIIGNKWDNPKINY